MSQQTQSRPPLQLQPWNRSENIELHQKPQSKASECRAQTHQRVAICIGNSSGGVPGAGQSGYFEKIKPIQNRSGLAIERLKGNTHTDQSNLDNAVKHQIKSEWWQWKHQSHQQLGNWSNHLSRIALVTAAAALTAVAAASLPTEGLRRTGPSYTP